MNDATRHQGTHRDAWKSINALIGEEVTVNSSKDGRMKWKVVGSESMTQDDFKLQREMQEKYKCKCQ